MTLNDQIAVIEQLPLDEQKALTLICSGQDQEVPEYLLVELLRKRLVTKKRAGLGYAVISHWVHYAWQLWHTEQEESHGRP